MLFQHESIRKSKMLFKYERMSDIVRVGDKMSDGRRQTAKVRQQLSYHRKVHKFQSEEDLTVRNTIRR